MKALVAYGVKKLGWEERPIPEPGPGEVLLKPRAIGLCGSDIHLFNGTHPYRIYPNIFGHEVSSWVVKAGEGVSNFSERDHVVLEPYVYCGTCYPCRIGRNNCCSRMKTIGVTVPGAMADYFVAPARHLYQVPRDLDPKAASLAEPLGVGFHATTRGNVQKGEKVFIIGAGAIGLSVLAAAKQKGAHVAVSDLIDRRLEVATAMGADFTVNSAKTDPVQFVREWTGGDMCPVVFEAVGHPKTIESTISLVSDAGRVVIVGVTEERACIRGVDMTKKELSVYGSRNSLGRIKDAIEYIIAHTETASKMITAEYPFSQAIEAMEEAESHPERFCKVMLNFEA
jgi:2-desacetyl-2-hydroxyethyl bacteriochlorophyllide A dehydrogenase